MDDGYGMNAVTGARRQGYDIGPNEDRFSTPVDMLTLRENSQGNLDYEYEQVFIARSSDGIFYEPLDETPSIPEPAGAPGNIIRATDSRYHSEANRLQTFDERWLDNDYHVKRTDLARDGFIHIGPGDKVKCVFCLNTLRNWEPNDSVEIEHRRHYPDCPFVRGMCDHLNVPINRAENMKRSFGLKMKTSEQHVSENQMQDFSSRLRSFANWPKQVPVRPDALAEAGLFYNGVEDKVTCFSCGKIFSMWEPGDDPWFEHAKWSPNCAFLLEVKGSEYVSKVQKRVIDDKRIEEEMVTATNEPAIKKENNFAAPTSDKEHQHIQGSSHEVQSGHSVQESSSQLDIDLRNAEVKAICETYDVPIDRMRQMINEMRITRGEDLKSAAVKDVCQTYDVPIEKMIQMLERLHLKKGTR